MTFTVSDKARISLDGREATFKDLRMGLYARVHTDMAGAGTTGSTTGTAGSRDKGTSGSGTASGGDRAGSGVSGGAAMTASRIEAFTKAPTGAGSGTGTGTGTGTSGRPGGKADR